MTLKKRFKHICIVKFDNRSLEGVRLPKIFLYLNIIKALHYNLQKKDSFSATTIKLGNTARNNIVDEKY